MLPETQLLLHRRNTKRYINSKPTEIQLSIIVKTMVSGTKVSGYSDLRQNQTFRIIWQGENGVVKQPPSGTRRFDFVLLGEYDADVAIGDFWEVESEDESGKVVKQKYVIEYIYPGNGYEVKAGGVSHGSSPA